MKEIAELIEEIKFLKKDALDNYALSLKNKEERHIHTHMGEVVAYGMVLMLIHNILKPQP